MMRMLWQRRHDEADEPTPSTASVRDERIAAYLDGLLTVNERAAVEREVERDSEFRSAVEGMRDVRSSLGALGVTRAPRAFALTADLAPRSRGLPRLELFARLATVATALATVAVFALPSMTGTSTKETSRAGSPVTVTRPAAQDSSAPSTSGAQKQAGGPQLESRSAAPAGAGGTLNAAPAPATAPESFASPAAAAPVASAPSRELDQRAVELANGARDETDDFWGAQLGLALLTVLLATGSGVLWLRRRL